MTLYPGSTPTFFSYCANGHVWMTGDGHCFSEEVSGDTGGSADASEYPRERLE
jgi:hypothetical protein